MTLYQCRGLFFSTLLAFLLFTLAAGDWSAARADSSKTKIRRGGYGLIQNGALTVSHQAEKLFVPASTIKILTADAALWLLGEDYRFTTRFFLTADNSLAIRGGGDPFLVSENIITIVRKLKEQGIDRINNLILDDFLFDISGPPEGSINSTNPYDSHNSALAVNFNSIAIYKKKNGTVSSDEQQTPTLPIMRKLGRHLRPGHHRINVEAFGIDSDLSNSLTYSGQLFIALLKKEGIDCSGKILHSRVPEGSRPLLAYHGAKNLKELIVSCLKYSNNFIANQIFLTLGTVHSGEPATWKKSRAALRKFAAEQVGLKPNELIIREGSGLSRKNMATVKGLLTILNHFSPHYRLMSKRYGVRLKSGTMKGIYCYAGYFQLGGRLDPFVILLNQKENGRDKVLRMLRRRWEKGEKKISNVEHGMSNVEG